PCALAFIIPLFARFSGVSILSRHFKHHSVPSVSFISLEIHAFSALTIRKITHFRPVLGWRLCAPAPPKVEACFQPHTFCRVPGSCRKKAQGTQRIGERPDAASGSPRAPEGVPPDGTILLKQKFLTAPSVKRKNPTGYLKFGDIHKTRISTYCKDIYLEKRLKSVQSIFNLVKKLTNYSFVDNNLLGKENRCQNYQAG
ncbi:hypothetical protein QQ056_19815, partial [Oscillatoria laete-virens NRMC-F 0139]